MAVKQFITIPHQSWSVMPTVEQRNRKLRKQDEAAQCL